MRMIGFRLRVPSLVAELLIGMLRLLGFVSRVLFVLYMLELRVYDESLFRRYGG